METSRRTFLKAAGAFLCSSFFVSGFLKKRFQDKKDEATEEYDPRDFHKARHYRKHGFASSSFDGVSYKKKRFGDSFFDAGQFKKQ